MREWMMGWDLGSSGAKAVAFIPGESAAASAHADYDLVSRSPGWSDLDLARVEEAILACTDELLAESGLRAADALSIGVASMCPGLVPLDEQGRPLMDAISVVDTRSRAQAAFLKDRIGDDAFFAAGKNRIMPGANSLTSMLWIRDEAPEIYRRTAAFGHVPTWMGSRLTGEIALDLSNASYTGVFDTGASKAWLPAMADAVGLDSAKMPRLAKASDRLGGLRLQALLDRGFRRGLPVAVGGADTACAALALGVVGDGERFLSLGTSSVLCGCFGKSEFDDRFMNRCHVAGDAWLMNGAMSNTGLAFDWFMNKIRPDLSVECGSGKDEAFRRARGLMSEAAPGAGGVVFLPYLNGERSPVWDPDARGVFFGLNSRTTAGDLLRAVNESCAYGTRQLLGAYESISRPSPSLTVIGGGAKNDALLRIISDIAGKELEAYDLREAAAVGGALLGGLAAGIFPDERAAAASVPRRIRARFVPDAAHAAVYDEAYGVYEALYPALSNVFVRKGAERKVLA